MLSNLQGLGLAGRAADPASAVLETLGRYPDAALDWVSKGLLECTDSGLPNRIDYWFGQRLWDSDGYQGVSALWAGMQNATGADLSAGYDADAWRRLQTANAYVWEALALSDNFDVSAVSVFGATYLADALESQLVVVGGIAVVGATDVYGLDHRELLQDLALPGVGSRWVPRIPADYLYRVFGIAASYESTHDSLETAIKDLQRQLTASGQDSTVMGVKFALALQGLNDGSAGGAGLAAATARDEAMGQGVDALATAANLATSLKVADPIAGFVVGEGIGLAQDAAKDWVSVYDDVLAETYGTSATREEKVSQATAEFIQQNFTPEEWDEARVFIGTRSDAKDQQVVNGYTRSYASGVSQAQTGAEFTAENLRNALDTKKNGEQGDDSDES